MTTSTTHSPERVMRAYTQERIDAMVQDEQDRAARAREERDRAKAETIGKPYRNDELPGPGVLVATCLALVLQLVALGLVVGAWKLAQITYPFVSTHVWPMVLGWLS